MEDLDVEKIKEKVLNILAPIKPLAKTTGLMSFGSKRSNAGRQLSDYYLVYFLLVDLLGFKDTGKFEKIAWSIPIEYNGKLFTIEHRKLGLGIFINNDEDEVEAEEIVKKINGAIKAARPYFNFLASQAIKSSDINVKNKNVQLLSRFNYFLSLYKLEKAKQDEESKKEHYYEQFQHAQNSNWLAITVIEAFFSWTEHLFVHLAVITGKIKTGEEIASLAGAEWKTKFNKVITESSLTKFLQELLLVRVQVRNYVGHGAFGKDGSAFSFHSNAGAVPVVMSFDAPNNKFSLQGSLEFNDEAVIEMIENFIKELYKSSLSPAILYTQENELPTIVPFASNGTYEQAMESVENMEILCHRLQDMIDNAANMDW